MKTKVLVLFLILFGHMAFSQQNSVEFSNTSNCNWRVVFYDGALNVLLDIPLNASSSSGSCTNIFSGTVVSMSIYNPSDGCAVNWGPSGGTQTGMVTYCGWACSVSNTTDVIQAIVNTITCGGPPVSTNEYTISITP